MRSMDKKRYLALVALLLFLPYMRAARAATALQMPGTPPAVSLPVRHKNHKAFPMQKLRPWWSLPCMTRSAPHTIRQTPAAAATASTRQKSPAESSWCMAK